MDRTTVVFINKAVSQSPCATYHSIIYTTLPNVHNDTASYAPMQVAAAYPYSADCSRIEFAKTRRGASTNI